MEGTMRRILILVAFITCVVGGSGVILYGLTHSAQHEPTRTILLAGLLLIFLTLIPLGIYVIRQMIAQDKQLRRYGIANISLWQLLRMKSEGTRPYRRETKLQLILFVSCAFVVLAFPIVGLCLPVIMPDPYSSDAGKSDQQLQVEFHQWQAYQDTFSQTEHFIDWACCLEFPVGCLTYALLSKDLTQLKEEA
ncbi:hypothetical protein [Dictyobacter formicarum]|uniref:DUF5671 domain-containing protein n=1 Tax=Dictyobacter formicarum TaxID=2778368 RepID=A0ABQ3VCB4_9CHLR|nr:hypothetical protein [Dictyobacter formicarum]GHO83303.1 hypothetical protein KSZ_13090 [Dictyobacter formicarum]